MMSEEKAEYMNSPVYELKPRCPACKSINLMIETWSSGDCAVFDAAECMDCHTKVNDVRKWNTRAESPDSVEEWPKVELMHNESQYEVFQITASNGQQALVYPDDTALYELIKAKTLPAPQSRSTPPPVAGGELQKNLAMLKEEIIGSMDNENAEAWAQDTLGQAIAALQHQDCVVVSRECVDAALNDMKSIRAMCMRADMYPSHKQLAELEQSLERKNGQ